MMDGWDKWMGKKVYLVLRSERIYTGVVQEIDKTLSPIIFITILDKFKKPVTFATSEIVQIKEEAR